MSRRSHCLVLFAAMAAGHFVALPANAQPSGAGEKKAAAQALFDDARRLTAAGKDAEACPKYQESQRLDPAPGTEFYLAECLEKTGKLASAWSSYVEVADQEKAAGHADREKFARARAEALAPRLPRLTVVVPDAVRSTEGLVVERNGAPLGAPQWGLAIPVDPGVHVVSARAPGKTAWKADVDAGKEGALVTVTVPVLQAVAVVPPPIIAVLKPPPAPAPRPATASPPAPPPPRAMQPPPPGADRAVDPRAALSHRGQLGGVARADIEGRGRGMLAVVGLTYGLGDYVDLGAAALLGRDKGAEVSANVLLLRGTWKPFVAVGVPMFFVDGARPGVRGGVGIEWDASRHFGAFLSANVAAFPSAPSGYEQVVFVPSIGVQPRL